MLEDAANPLAYELAFWIQAFEDPAYPLDQLGNLSQELTLKFRALAIIAMVSQSSIDGFCHNLIRSARVRIGFLQRVHEKQDFDQHHNVSGRYRPLADAIAAGDLGRAGRIVSLAPAQFRGPHEYEDDYCFARLLGMLAGNSSDAADLAEVLKRYEDYLDGDSDARLDVVAAIVSRDQAGFEDGFENLLRERTESIAADIERARLETPEILAERKIYIEALALLRLADAAGLTTETDYLYCPSPARRPMQAAFPGQ